MTQVQELSATFQEEKHIVLKSFVEYPLLKVSSNYIIMMSKVGKTDKGGLQVIGS